VTPELEQARERVAKGIRDKQLSNSMDLVLSGADLLKLKMLAAERAVNEAIRLLSDSHRGYNRIIPYVTDALRRAKQELNVGRN